jgi:hypothetical protein
MGMAKKADGNNRLSELIRLDWGSFGASCDAPRPRLSGRCRIGQETFAGASSRDGPAPTTVIRCSEAVLGPTP